MSVPFWSDSDSTVTGTSKVIELGEKKEPDLVWFLWSYGWTAKSNLSYKVELINFSSNFLSIQWSLVEIESFLHAILVLVTQLP